MKKTTFLNSLLGFFWLNSRLSRLVVVGICFMVSSSPSFARDIELGDPPQFPADSSGFQLQLKPSERKQTERLAVNPQNREESELFFTNCYLSSQGYEINWTGNHELCNAGMTAQDFRDAVLLRINYFRAMAGVPATVAFDDTYNNKAQKAALMMSANNQLSHSPSPSWICYSDDGSEAAGSSNLCLGVFGWNAITGYIQDPGSSNYPVGHRRWILYPQTQFMGTGDIPYINSYTGSNALWVFDSNMWGPRPDTRDEFVAWPPPGYVPYQVVFQRWSFSFPQANFDSTSVTMISNGNPVDVDVQSVVNGYGENTLVWVPSIEYESGNAWPKPTEDTTYAISVNNAVIEGVVRNFTYNVIIFDPSESVPTVTTNSVSSVTASTASSGGNVTSEGSASVTARGVCWSTSATPTTANSHTTDGTGTGTYSSSITGLSPGTPYHARAYATNSIGTGYGSDLTFTTATTSCPDCSGTEVNLVNVTFVSGTTCECVGTTSIIIGTGVTVQSGATVTFKAPTIRLRPGFHAEEGAVVRMKQQ